MQDFRVIVSDAAIGQGGIALPPEQRQALNCAGVRAMTLNPRKTTHV
jgi:hypothetical protein